MADEPVKNQAKDDSKSTEADDVKIPAWLKMAGGGDTVPAKVEESVPASSDVVASSEEAAPAKSDEVASAEEVAAAPESRELAPPGGLLETSKEETAQPEKAEIPAKTDEEKIEQKDEKVEEAKKKKDVFNSAKDLFAASAGKVGDAMEKGKTAGVPESKPEEKSEEKTDEKATEEEGVKKTEEDKEIKVEEDEKSTPTEKKEEKKKPPAKEKTKETAEEKRKLVEAEKIYQEGLTTIRDLIAPSSMEIKYDSIRVEGMYARSFFVYAYPRYLETNWLSPIVNFDVTMDIAQFIYPISSSEIMKVLKKKVTQMQSSVRMKQEKGVVSDPALETALGDAEQLRVQIQRGQEKFFQFGLYFTIYADSEKKIDKIAKHLESLLGGKLVLTKRADLQMEHAFNSTLPLCIDELEVNSNMNTSPLSSTFPFSSSDLTSNEGILYGLNRHNDSLIIFDRFSLENANSVVFAKSGAGKSYGVKLEILRSMMVGTDVIVIDPENEYEALSQTVGGSYLKVSLTSDRRINPFDLPQPLKDEEPKPGDLLRSNIISLSGLLKIMLGGISPEEEAIVDKALIDVYALKGITMELADPSEMVPPTMEDLFDVLTTMEGATSLAQRIEKYTSGTYSGIFNKPTNVDLQSGLMVFSIRDLEDSLRPIAMYIILNYIWNRVRSELKKRILVIDEAWTMMQYEDSAKFMFGLVKRARKYFLGITTITQDVDDFIKSPYGKPVVTNSSMQLLLKQAPSSVELLGKVFNLTDGEKYMLLNSGVGQGLFFAGLKHVAIQIIASYTEDKIVTTNPEEILKSKETEAMYESAEEETPAEAVVEAEPVVDAVAEEAAPVAETPASEAPVAEVPAVQESVVTEEPVVEAPPPATEEIPPADTTPPAETP